MNTLGLCTDLQSNCTSTQQSMFNSQQLVSFGGEVVLTACIALAEVTCVAGHALVRHTDVPLTG